MIVLDASVAISHFAAHDTHHEAATAFLASHLDDEFAMHTITLTEVLVGPIRARREAFAEQQLAQLGIAEWRPPAGGAARLARLRVETGLKLPDCCVLDAAMSLGAPLVTFDVALQQAARRVGLGAIEI